MATVIAGEVAELTVEPVDMGLAMFQPSEIAGGDAGENAAILREVLEGRGSEAQRAVVAANAGAAIWIAGGAPALRPGVERALEVIASAAPARLLEDFVALTRRLAPTSA